MQSTSLAADLANQTAPPITACKLCLTIKALKPEDAAAVKAALARGISDEHLWKLLKIHGHPTPRRHIRDHKKEGHE